MSAGKLYIFDTGSQPPLDKVLEDHRESGFVEHIWHPPDFGNKTSGRWHPPLPGLCTSGGERKARGGGEGQYAHVHTWQTNGENVHQVVCMWLRQSRCYRPEGRIQAYAVKTGRGAAPSHRITPEIDAHSAHSLSHVDQWHVVLQASN